MDWSSSIYKLCSRVLCLCALAIVLPQSNVRAEEKTPQTAAIIGGSLGSSSLFPAVAAIYVGTGICTGTLIAPNYVLTAGHCAFDDRGRVIRNMEEIFLSVGGVERGARSITVHPDYDNQAIPCTEGIPDASLIELDEPINSIAPIAVSSTPPAIGSELLLVGYGMLGSGESGESGQFPADGTLAYGNTTVDDLDSTFIMWRYKASRGGANTAGGDSGGPALQTINNQLVLQGITCGGTGNAQYGTQSFDTRADVLIEWLSQFILVDISSSPPFITAPHTINARAQKTFSTAVHVTGLAPVATTVSGLPAGVVFENGVIHGIPASAGVYPLTIEASNQNGTRTLSTTLIVKPPDTIFRVLGTTLQFDQKFFASNLLTIRGRLRLKSSRLSHARSLTVQFGAYQRSFPIGFKRRRSRSGGDSFRIDNIQYLGRSGQLTLDFKASIFNPAAFSEIRAIGFPEASAAAFGQLINLPITFQFDGNHATLDQPLSLNSGDLRWHLVK